MLTKPTYISTFISLLSVKELIHLCYDTLYFQRAVGGTERAAYEKLIAPFMNDMPKRDVDVFTRVCDERKYALMGSNLFRTLKTSSLSCQMVSLPGTSYPETLTYIISKTSHYKGLINWR
jgi:hypothetical protein